MDFLQTYAKEIISTLTPFILVVVNRLLTSPARLIQGTKHAFTFLLQELTFDNEGNVVAANKNVHTASIVFANTGRNPATNIEITFNWKPQHVNLWPLRPYDEHTSPDLRWSLKLPSLAPKEHLTIELLSVVDPLPAIMSARCEQCEAKQIPLVPQEQHSRWKLAVVAWLMFSGAAVSIYLFFLLLQFATRPAP